MSGSSDLKNLISSSLCAKFDENPSRGSRYQFMKQEVAVTFNFWPPKPDQFISESEWTLVQRRKKVPQSALETLCSQVFPRRTTWKNLYNASVPGCCHRRGTTNKIKSRQEITCIHWKWHTLPPEALCEFTFHNTHSFSFNFAIKINWISFEFLFDNLLGQDIPRCPHRHFLRAFFVICSPYTTRMMNWESHP